ncbi:MAG: NAD(P)H-binding protein [Gemmatimonadales bacterium]|nr:NAD(P)H-binding protein [Gemmatimonadales bacterium]MYC87570.1 NAD(P)H-binding protein [Candidatus Palauibacter denitrificans]
MQRILVAGGTGFLGRAFVRGLHGRGARVAVLTRNPAGAGGLGLPAEYVQGDVRRPDTLARAMDAVDAAILSVQFPGYPVEAPARGRTFMEVDAHGTAALVEAAAEAGVRKLVYLSGVGADPGSARTWYRAKGLAEASVRNSGLDHVIVRPSWVYGPEDRSLNRFIAVIRRIPFVFPQLGDGSGRITPIHVDDLSALVCEATLGSAGDGLTLEAGGPDVLSLDDVVRTAMAALGRRRAILHIPEGLVKLAAAWAERLPGQILSRDAVDFATQDGIADSDLARHRFPVFRPRDLATGLAAYVSRA